MQTAMTDDAFLGRLVDESDQYVKALLGMDDGAVAALPHRAAMARLLALVTVFSEPASAFYRREEPAGAMAACLDRLEFLQGPTGLLDGTNLCSPPDSAFTINDLCLAVRLIRTQGVDKQPAQDSPANAPLAGVEERLGGIALRAADAMISGGVHTPNHRWELCAALAQMNQLHPRAEIPSRISEWLAEGIDQLPDGMYSERSPLYATAVTNPSLITIADSGDRPELLDHVRRNLTAFLPWFNADGSVESVFSRRQDQWLVFHAAPFLRLFRRFANQDGREDFAAAARWLESLPFDEPAHLLALTRVDPWLRQALPGLPASSTVFLEDAGTGSQLPPALTPPQASLKSCGLYRFRRGASVTTVFGGCDDLATGVSSGLASNPTFLSFGHGSALLSSVRLSRSFFDLGPFRSSTTVRNDDAVQLSEAVEANFYLPLPAGKHRTDGIYALEHEGRFSASMDFSSRPTVVHRLETRVEILPEEDRTVLDLAFDGADTAFALELTFRPGGGLTGVDPLQQSGTFQLVDGTGRYRVGSDVIEFGPGEAADPDTPPLYNPGENYRYLGGTNAAAGIKVYITGRTRGTHRITLRGLSLES